MPILNYTTSIDCEKTIGEIQKCLSQHGAKKIIVDYDDEKTACGVTFCLEVNGNLLAFSLPANYVGVLNAMQKSKKIPNNKRNKEQALKVSWRIIKDWVEAQMAIVETQLADIAEVFLPYAVTANGSTLYKEIKAGGMKMLKQGD